MHISTLHNTVMVPKPDQDTSCYIDIQERAIAFKDMTAIIVIIVHSKFNHNIKPGNQE